MQNKGLKGLAISSLLILVPLSVSTAYAENTTIKGGKGGSPVYHWGDTGPDGGIVFYVDGSGQHGLEAQPADAMINNSAVTDWATAISAGASYNRTAITNALSCSASIAPSTPNCWHLPSKTELEYLYEQRAVVGGFASSSYWSSTDYSSTDAWFQGFGYGYQNYWNKLNKLPVRAVRAF